MNQKNTQENKSTRKKTIKKNNKCERCGMEWGYCECHWGDY